MHTVVLTPKFLADAKFAGVSESEMEAIIDVIAADPSAGDLIPETGGARKVRIGGRGRGKSGGYRVITFYVVDDLPVFLASSGFEGAARRYQPC